MTENWTPAACTLPTAERPLRHAEFDELFATAAQDRLGETRLRLTLAPEPEIAARAADLIVRETECCSFFTFTLAATGGSLTLDVDGPAEVLDALADRAAS